MLTRMGRWEPDARGRLETAALELFAERGYELTTVEDIATRAGVTKRTYFRHFADKREVLFGGSSEFRHLFVAGLAALPDGTPAGEVVASTLRVVGAALGDRRERARRRQAVIAASAELRERELVKLASVADALATCLRERGMAEPAASITAETALAVFRVAFQRWVTADEAHDLSSLLAETLQALPMPSAP